MKNRKKSPKSSVAFLINANINKTKILNHQLIKTKDFQTKLEVPRLLMRFADARNNFQGRSLVASVINATTKYAKAVSTFVQVAVY